MKAIRIALLILVAIPFALARAQDTSSAIVISRDRGPDPSAIKLTQIAAGFKRPLYVTHAADGSESTLPG